MVKLSNSGMNGCANIYVKLEEFNPGGSIKSRVSLNMLKEAEKMGLLKPFSNQTVIEPTGGNTGIGLALLGAIRGYRVLLVIPDNYSKNKISIIEAYGAKVILSDHTKGNNSHVEKVREIIQEHPDYVWLDQLNNLANPTAHYFGTGQEIVTDFSENNISIDAFVAGMGSGGSFSGIGQKIKESFREAKTYLVQPQGYDVFSNKFVFHNLQGWGIGLIPKVFNRDIVDYCTSVNYEEAVEMQRKMAKEEGLLLGISSGGNIAASKKIASEIGPNRNVVTIAPDSGLSYLSSFQYEQ